MTHSRSLNHTKWHCQYHVVLIPKYRKKAIDGQLRASTERMVPRMLVRGVRSKRDSRRRGTRLVG